MVKRELDSEDERDISEERLHQIFFAALHAVAEETVKKEGISIQEAKKDILDRLKKAVESQNQPK